MPIPPGLISTGIVLAAASAWVRPAETDQLKLQLISDTGCVQPGRPLLLGLHFQMRKHWHIYWRNPGDSGEPPRVRWKLPAGFQAGDLQWPAPERLGSGSVIDYGYQESVLLPVEIRTPGPSLGIGGSVTLSAEVSWLACDDRCVPGKADLTLTLPVRAAPGPAPASHALFQAAGSRLPRPLPPTWRAEATSGKEAFVLTVHGAGVGKPAFFPFEAGQIDNAAPQTAAAFPGGVRLILRKSEQLSKPPARLDGILKLSSGRAYAVSTSVRPLPGQPAQP